MSKCPVHKIGGTSGGIEWTKTGERMLTQRAWPDFPKFTDTDYSQYDVVAVRFTGSITIKPSKSTERAEYGFVAGGDPNKRYPRAGVVATFSEGTVTKPVSGAFLFFNQVSSTGQFVCGSRSVYSGDIEIVYEYSQYASVNEMTYNVKQEIWGGKLEL